MTNIILQSFGQLPLHKGSPERVGIVVGGFLSYERKLCEAVKDYLLNI